jgi:N-glycosylase/DNA lyase
VEQIYALNNPGERDISEILKGKARFHNNKARYVILNRESWNNLKNRLENPDIRELRDWLAENVHGYGMKEASHFLRNIGLSNNQIAILDRHILKNLYAHSVIPDTKIRGKKDYLEKEQAYLDYAKKIEIPADELDLLWWSLENGEIFK